MSTSDVINMKSSLGPTNTEQPSQLNLSANEDLELLYDTTFYEVVMNATGRYELNQYDTILAIICPSLSYRFFSMFPKRAEDFISAYCKVYPQELEFLSKLPDRPSAINHVFLHYFKEFHRHMKSSGFQDAMDLYQDFYFTNEEIFKSLPISYVFSLVNFIEKK